MRSTANGTRTVMLMAPSGSSFTDRSIRTGPSGPNFSSGGRRTICGR
jgi:hypothetical protein